MVASDKSSKLSILFGILLFFLLTYPLLEVFNRETRVAGIPFLVLYLFGIWLVAIVALFILGRRFRLSW